MQKLTYYTLFLLLAFGLPAALILGLLGSDGDTTVPEEYRVSGCQGPSFKTPDWRSGFGVLRRGKRSGRDSGDTGRDSLVPLHPYTPDDVLMIWPTISHNWTDGHGTARPPRTRTNPRDYTVYHHGLDLHCSCGEPIYAAMSGTVTRARWVGTPPGGYGYTIRVQSGDFMQQYAHLSKMHVEPGDQVIQGEVIGECGTTGFSTGCHLDYEVEILGNQVDPAKWLPSKNAVAGGDTIIRFSYYQPWLGGTNCAKFVGGKCVSSLADGDPWEDYMERAVACPPEWDFGTKLLVDGKIWVCKDRGGGIKYDDGIPWVDFLTADPDHNYRDLIAVTVVE